MVWDLWSFKDLEEKDDLMSELINDRGVEQPQLTGSVIKLCLLFTCGVQQTDKLQNYEHLKGVIWLDLAIFIKKVCNFLF